ncbi:TonB-dependent receptor [Neiella marina]|uniref:TonB-dependent receptor n=1 Tax=Neiella marina TaxID=508461 RepID=A0A8J2U4A3_9GAMM|nr:TonB-dependent receptor [Neiella marina]GGA73630.1 TonB-dependent receptor [Neiella marina]
MNMQQSRFRPTLICKSVALILGTTVSAFGLAAEEVPADDTEVIQVTGIRASQIKSQDIKRSSSGVVDAISAEDIGKFPDTNLAESLQRITGVSIDRRNNEGSKVTVRGFGPEFNLVLLNNRMMPTAQVSAQSTRSFDFANIASESVSGVEISKTGKADVSSGGIGSTINIRTARPFDDAGFHATVGVKGVADRSVEDGDSVTPEISGFISDTFAEDTFGVSLSFAYQERDSAVKFANVDGWRPNLDHSLAGSVIDNNENPYGYTWYPRNMGFGIENNERTRTNGQLTFQWAPMDTVTATLDYTYSKLEIEAMNEAWGQWMNHGAPAEMEINENGTVVYAREYGGDFMSRTASNDTEHENKSLGLNVKWQATDNMEFEFDYHDSNATAEAYRYGWNGFQILGALGASDDFTFDARNTDIPLLDMNWNGDGKLTAEDYRPLFAMNNFAENDTDVKQYQLSGKWINDSNDSLTSIDFGIARTEFETSAVSYQRMIGTGWYCCVDEDYWPLMQEETVGGGFLDDFSGGGSDIIERTYFSYDFESVIQLSEDKHGFDLTDKGDPISHHIIEEETDSAFIQLNFESEFNEMPLNVVAGFRYETTDVTSRSEERVATDMQWTTAQEWHLNYQDEKSFSNEQSDYKVFLPNLDFSLEVMDDVVTRFSYSKTVTRSDLTALRGTTALTNAPKIGRRNGDAGNPALEPYSADNFDFSVEYYYGDASYVSVGWFNKEVENFIANVFVEGVQYDQLRDIYEGPRANAARAELADEGMPLTDENIFNKIHEMQGTDPANPIMQSAEDPLADWQIRMPTNAEDLRTHGWELAIQHWFWDTGFGASANATLVSGDTELDIEDTQSQFALPGLSDSYNFSVFYDKDGLQARAAYNWRDDFYSADGQPEQGGEPQFTESYGQLDVSISYDINDTFNVFLEGLNVLEEEQRIHGRYKEQLIRANQQSARYAVGVRAKF